MTKKSTINVPFGSTRLDDTLAIGGAATICHEDGSTIRYHPLIPVLGAVVKLRVRYRCADCGSRVAVVQDYLAASTGERVWLFAGDVYRDEDQRQLGYTSYAFLQPDLGAAPACMCAKHGLLSISADEARRAVQLSIDLEIGRQRKSEDQRSTVTRKLKPVGAS